MSKELKREKETGIMQLNLIMVLRNMNFRGLETKTADLPSPPL